MLAIVFSSLYCTSGNYHVRALDVGSRHVHVVGELRDAPGPLQVFVEDRR